MAFERTDFLALMPSTVSISTRASHNSYGEPSFGTATNYRARIVNAPGFVRDPFGESVLINTIVWVASTGTIDVSDRVALPDGTTPPIVLVERYPDGDGTHHHKLSLGYTVGTRT